MVFAIFSSGNEQKEIAFHVLRSIAGIGWHMDDKTIYDPWAWLYSIFNTGVLLVRSQEHKYNMKFTYFAITDMTKEPFSAVRCLHSSYEIGFFQRHVGISLVHSGVAKSGSMCNISEEKHQKTTLISVVKLCLLKWLSSSVWSVEISWVDCCNARHDPKYILYNNGHNKSSLLHGQDQQY